MPRSKLDPNLFVNVVKEQHLDAFKKPILVDSFVVWGDGSGTGRRLVVGKVVELIHRPYMKREWQAATTPTAYSSGFYNNYKDIPAYELKLKVKCAVRAGNDVRTYKTTYTNTKNFLVVEESTIPNHILDALKF